jgi:hypothetical protein
MSMRDRILMLLIASMLVVSMEGMADVVDDASFHQTHHAHADDADNQWFPNSDGDDHESDGSAHFCHAHGVGLAGQVMPVNAPAIQYFVPVPPAQIVAHIVPPPIPPPNI